MKPTRYGNDGGTTTRSIDENAGDAQSTGAPIGGPVTANDPNPGQTVTYSLGGTNAASFTLNANNGQISTKAGTNTTTRRRKATR